MVYILNLLDTDLCVEFSGGSAAKEFTCNAGDVGLIPGLGRSPEEGNGKPLQYTCLENPMDRGGWQATVHGVTRCWTLICIAGGKICFYIFILKL